MRRVLVMLTLGMTALCLGATSEETDGENTTTADCVSECKSSDHPGCERACNAATECAVGLVGR